MDFQLLGVLGNENLSHPDLMFRFRRTHDFSPKFEKKYDS